LKKLHCSVLVFSALTTVGALVATAAQAQSAPTIWVAPAAQKVQPQTQPDAHSATSATLAAAQNEFESFHVVVTGQARGVSMALDKLDDGNGHVISGRDVVLYREALINVTQPSGGDGAVGQWPDALVPDVDPVVGEKRNAFPFDVAAGQSIAVLVDIHVPQGAPAGLYGGTLSVTGGASAQVPIQLTVWDFALPSTSSLRSAWGMAWNGPCMGHGDGACSNAPAESALRARYVQVALDNRISIDLASTAVPVDPAGNGDWSTYDREAGQFLDGKAPTRLAGARLTSARITAKGPTTAAVSKAWGQHFRDRGWHDAVYDYTCDEPPMTCAWADINGRIAQVKAGDPTIPTVVTTTVQDAQKNGVNGIDIYVPLVNFMDDKPNGTFPNSQRGNYGPTVWWYQSCMSFGCAGIGGAYTAGTNAYESGWPTMAIDADGTRNRAMEWLSFAYGMSGELYYETTQAFFSGDPWQNQYNFGGTGDGTVFYPGTPAKIGGQTEIPVESLRMKMVRDGMEDFELLQLASNLGLRDQALQIARGVYPRTFQASTSPAALDSARAELAALILHAQGKSAAATTSQGTVTNPGSPASVLPPTAVHASAGGCSTGGKDFAWVAPPLVAVLLSRRRRAGSC
jgi:hypothetical protein